MRTLREWQKELVGLGVGAGAVHALLGIALILAALYALGVFAH
jgi:hypothetical protein